ncbi:MAG: KUP/HAK/KT family potassium transporter [Candidatus Gastranaerophilales bacterium]|nr:KUP/HAK/KT family potassium transporter [Candidatus Gastranaerophilales bacterium]
MKSTIDQIIKSMGLVFGDIGTSPIYTLTVIFLTLPVSAMNILSILSLMIWTLIFIVSVQYAWLAMSLSQRGEGGEIVLNQILQKLIKSSRAVLFFSLLTYVGVSLMIGDSIITPAISILSAVEGFHFIPAFDGITQTTILVITIFITLALFLVQNHGTEKISKVFGPIMIVWFVALAGSGVLSIADTPFILRAFNPMYGINFLLHHGLPGFFVLSEVILCATGAEALYADMGHLGAKPIIQAWCFVFVALVLNYLGQGVFLLHHPNAQNILFNMVLHQTPHFYIPFLVVSICATIIASQAMISGMFSVVYQGINTQIFPLFKVDYTSEKLSSQIYIGAINWFLLVSVLAVILFFQESSKLAAAYGFAVTATIAITALMMLVIFYLRKKYWLMGLTGFLFFIDLCFFLAATSKIPSGAYVSIILAIIPLALILLYTMGHRALYRSLKPMPKDKFLPQYMEMYTKSSKIAGTALFFARGIDRVPPYVVQTMFINGIIYEDNIFIHVNKLDEAYGLSFEFTDVAPGLRLFKINVGYMQVFNVEKILNNAGIKEKVIFYGLEDIETTNVFWNLFAKVKKLLPSFISFYKLPSYKVHGVVTQINMD